MFLMFRYKKMTISFNSNNTSRIFGALKVKKFNRTKRETTALLVQSSKLL